MHCYCKPCYFAANPGKSLAMVEQRARLGSWPITRAKSAHLGQ
jgi:hypothetical protein